MNLEPEPNTKLYPNIWEDIPKKCSYNAKLPNLLYKDSKIIFNSKNPIQIKKDNILSYEHKFVLSSMNNKFNFNITCNSTDIICSIIPEEHPDGLEINMKFMDYCNIFKHDVQKFARAIEAHILGIDILDDS